MAENTIKYPLEPFTEKQIVKISVSVNICKQIGFEEWKDVKKTKVFDETASIKDILDWAKTFVKDITFGQLIFGEIE